MHKPSWQHYQNSAVRALAWSRLSPSLVNSMTGYFLSPSERDHQFFEQLDHQPSQLQQHLARCQSHRLGIYFETLWQFYLAHHPDYQLISHDLQIFNEQRRTLGAFDFIYQYLPDRSYHHLEVAVKFYLYTGDGAADIENMQMWPGPNPSDTLGNKVDRLQQHQLCLADTPEGETALEEMGALPLQSRSAVIKGYLFYPWSSQLPRPTWSSNQSKACHWLTIKELSELLDKYPNCQWMILEKRRWLGEAVIEVADEVQDRTELQKQITERISHFPLMVARFEEDSNTEAARYFVVPGKWVGKVTTLTP